MPDLKIDFCSFAAAKYAVLRWHYSKVMPSGRLINIGVWEESRFIGVVIFGRGANNNIGKPYGLSQYEVCELVRVALTQHQVTTSKVVSESIKLLKKVSPKTRLIVSYADANVGHIGTIYQATNWVYVGATKTEVGFRLKGKVIHRRTVSSKCGTSSSKWIKENIDPDCGWVWGLGKYKYLMPLDKKIRKQIAPLSRPYPKRKENNDYTPQVK